MLFHWLELQRSEIKNAFVTTDKLPICVCLCVCHTYAHTHAYILKWQVYFIITNEEDMYASFKIMFTLFYHEVLN